MILTQQQQIKLGTYIGEARKSLMKYDSETREFIYPTEEEIIQSAHERLKTEMSDG